jgi:hypothetical protein
MKSRGKTTFVNSATGVAPTHFDTSPLGDAVTADGTTALSAIYKQLEYPTNVELVIGSPAMSTFAQEFGYKRSRAITLVNSYPAPTLITDPSVPLKLRNQTKVAIKSEFLKYLEQHKKEADKQKVKNLGLTKCREINGTIDDSP